MVERIIVAGQTVLLRDGYEKASTNRVADEAGISPGSLYQYFPDREAVLAAVIDRHAAELSTRLTAVLADQLGASGPALVRAAFDGLVDVLTDNLEFLRLVVDGLPRTESRRWTAALEQRISDLVSAYLSINRGQTPQREPAVAAWILVQMVEHLSVRYVLDRPSMSRQTFVDELVDLTLGYVAPGPGGR